MINDISRYKTIQKIWSANSSEDVKALLPYKCQDGGIK